jgi:hypothetical protein
MDIVISQTTQPHNTETIIRDSSPINVDSVCYDLGLGTLDASQQGVPLADAVGRRTSAKTAASFHVLQLVARFNALFVQHQGVGLDLNILIDTMKLLFETMQSVP